MSILFWISVTVVTITLFPFFLIGFTVRIFLGSAIKGYEIADEVLREIFKALFLKVNKHEK